MNRDDLFRYLAGHRAPPAGCSRCGRVQVEYFRDVDELPVGYCCLFVAIGRLTPAEQAAVDQRLASLRHQCPAEGCPTCQETGA